MDLVNQNKNSLTYATRPTEWLSDFAKHLKGLQLAFRKDLVEEELAIWCQALRKFSMEQITEATADLLENPEHEYHGMPLITDLIRRIKELKAKRFEDEERFKVCNEMRELNRRRDAGEKFYGIFDYAHEMVTGKKAVPDA